VARCAGSRMDEYPRRFGSYVLLKPLARGGMGALHLAVSGEHGMEKLCVIKTVLPQLADPEYLRRFRDEAKVVVRLSHGNLVSVFDAGQVDGTLYLAMDYVEGRDLRATWNRCAQKGIAFPLDIACYIVKELSRGLAYAHNFGDIKLVHRDVSPPNVLLAYTGEVRLTDFGLASSTLKLERTAPGVIYGKVSYMAPEQARGEPLDGRTDLYAAGVILWELFTGRQLFPSAAPAPGAEPPPADEVLKKVRDPHPEPPSSRVGRVPPELDTIVMKAIAPVPANRYQNGEEMRADLAGWLAKNAPATDSDRMARFLAELFGDDMDRERHERNDLISGAVELRATEAKTGRLAGFHPRGLGEAPSTTEPSAPFSLSGPLFRSGSNPVPADFLAERGSASTATAHAVTAEGDLVGSTVGERYFVKRMIGEGGMGKVYEAEHVEIGKRVALKVLHPVYTRTPEVVERFRREARAASRIGHANVVDVTDSGTTPDGSFYFVMEYLEGEELGFVLHREGPLPVSRVLSIGAQMCRALQAAHDAGVVHRDLKPENVLLINRDGQSDFVKILDFGIAKSADTEDLDADERRLTHPGMAIGTPEYMAPEQAAGRQADARSDIYAAGAILYEVLTGHSPYAGKNFMEILHKKANETPPPITQFRDDVPAAMAAVIERAMARDPLARPGSMLEFERELLAIAETSNPPAKASLRTAPMEASGPYDGEAINAFGERVIERVQRLGPRKAAAVAVGLVAVVVALAIGLATREPPAPPVAAPPPTSPPSPPKATVEATPEPRRAPPPSRAPRPVAAPSPAPSPAVDNRRALADAQRLVSEGHYAEARDTLEHLRGVRNLAGPVHLALGEIAFQEGRAQEAVRLLRQSIKAAPSARAFVLLGDAYYKLSRYGDAVKAYKAALRKERDNPGARQGLLNAEKRLR